MQYGAKLANVFSTKFCIEIGDASRGLKYKQTFKDNMTTIEKPKISKAQKGYVMVKYLPDLQAFGLSSLSDDFKALLRRRVTDIAACARDNVKVFFNGKRLKTKGLEAYASLFIGSKKEVPRVVSVSERWRVCVAPSATGFQAISFVNGVFTHLGGTHVEHVIGQVSRKAADIITAKNKIAVKPSQVKDRLMVFLQATVVNPTFCSQTKDSCTTKPSVFGSSFEDADALALNICSKLNIVEDIVEESKMKETKNLSKTDGTKSSLVKGVPNLEDAIKAGTSKSASCTLVLTEGLSARTFAISGLSVVGREKWGVFPLKGKLLNMRSASLKQVAENAEFGFIKRIVGLKQGVKYESLSQLRYGRLMILADADVDGIHIRGLCINVIQFYWPELIKLGFICTLKTPIVKASKGSEVRSFFTLKEFDKFREEVKDGIKGYTCKYYKGLGTSSPQEAKEIFRSMDVVDYVWDDNADSSMELAFASKEANKRKDWIVNATENPPDEIDGSSVTLSSFVNRELVQFSIADVRRSIPSVVDGLKPSQRKVLFACFKKKLQSDIKVAQLTGYASEATHYHHGDASLSATIVNMAQVYIVAIMADSMTRLMPMPNVVLLIAVCCFALSLFRSPRLPRTVNRLPMANTMTGSLRYNRSCK